MRTSFHHQSEAQPPNGPLTVATSPDTPSTTSASQYRLCQACPPHAWMAPNPQMGRGLHGGRPRGRSAGRSVGRREGEMRQNVTGHHIPTIGDMKQSWTRRAGRRQSSAPLPVRNTPKDERVLARRNAGFFFAAAGMPRVQWRRRGRLESNPVGARQPGGLGANGSARHNQKKALGRRRHDQHRLSAAVGRCGEQFERARIQG
jgi:hypothetical protein